MTKTTNYEEKKILGQARGRFILSMCVSFSFEHICKLSITKFLSPLLFLFWDPLLKGSSFLFYIYT